MKLSYDGSVLSITYEGLTDFQSFTDFDSDSINSLSKACSKNIDGIIADIPNGISSKNTVTAMNTSTISIQQLVVATNDVKYYTAIGRMPKFEKYTTLMLLGSLRRTTMPTP